MEVNLGQLLRDEKWKELLLAFKDGLVPDDDFKDEYILLIETAVDARDYKLISDIVRFTWILRSHFSWFEPMVDQEIWGNLTLIDMVYRNK